MRPLLSNVLRNATLHLATPFDGLNASIQQAVLRLHGLVGADARTLARPTGRATFQYAASPSTRTRPGIRCTSCSPPRASACSSVGGRSTIGVAAVPRCLVGEALLFCLVLKWQPWHSRLHLPLFVLAAPFVAVQLERWLHPAFIATLVAAVLLAAIPWVIANQSRPLVGTAERDLDPEGRTSCSTPVRSSATLRWSRVLPRRAGAAASWA